MYPPVIIEKRKAMRASGISQTELHGRFKQRYVTIIAINAIADLSDELALITIII